MDTLHHILECKAVRNGPKPFFDKLSAHNVHHHVCTTQIRYSKKMVESKTEKKISYIFYGLFLQNNKMKKS